MIVHTALRLRVDELAIEVGRLRRHPACEPETSLAYLAERLADHVETLDCMLQPTAAELYVAFQDDGVDPDTALTRALDDTERRQQRFRSTLGTRQAA